jgi:hypothetical protein
MLSMLIKLIKANFIRCYVKLHEKICTLLKCNESIYSLLISYVFFSCMVQAFKNVLDKFVGVNLESSKSGVRWDAKWTLWMNWPTKVPTKNKLIHIWNQCFSSLDLYFYLSVYSSIDNYCTFEQCLVFV